MAFVVAAFAPRNGTDKTRIGFNILRRVSSLVRDDKSGGLTPIRTRERFDGSTPLLLKALMVSHEWFMVPKRLRAAKMTWQSSAVIRSATVKSLARGTMRPPEPL